MLLLFQLAPAQSRKQGTLLYLDGKNITGRAKFELKRDDLIRFDGYGLQAGSSLHLEARKKGVKFYDEDFETNQRGEFKTILFFPRVRSKIKCTASYTTKNGKSRKINFFLDPLMTGSKPKDPGPKSGSPPPFE